MRRTSLLALVLALFVAACGSSDTSSDDRAQQKGELRDLRIALGGEPINLDALAWSDSQADAFNMNVYEPLTTRDADGNLQPLLAESWDLQGKSWIFKLKTGVKFHDGTEMDADDVVASYKRVLDPSIKSLLKESALPGVTDVEKVDASSVKIMTESPDPTIPAKAALIVIAPAEWAAVDDNRLKTQMMGTGPYKFVKWRKGAEIDLVRNEDYWGTAGHFGNVKIVFRPEDSVRLDAVRAGEVDLAHNLPPDLAVQAPKPVSGPKSEVMTLRLNSLDGALLSDRRLREAVNLAIDREGIIKGLYSGQATMPQNQLVIPAVVGYNPDLEDPPYDPERAKQLVQEAGGDNRPLTFVGSVGKWAKDREIAQSIAQMLSDVGFDVKAEYDEPNKWHERAAAPSENPAKTPEAMFIGNSNELLDSVFTLSLYTCDGVISASCSREMTDLVKSGSAQVDTDARAKDFAGAWKALADGMYFAPLAVPNQTHGIATNMEWTPRPMGFMYFSDMEFTD